MLTYPATSADRDRFILGRRPDVGRPGPWTAPRVATEREPSRAGGAEWTATVFLTGRECPWRCAMCDLWMHTSTDDTPPGAIPWQIETARRAVQDASVPVVRWKLYNAGSFLDPRAVPAADYDAILTTAGSFDTLTIESHPSLVARRLPTFLDVFSKGRSAHALEVAMGLETAHPDALDRLNKRMTVADYSHAASFLRESGVGLRAFVLVSPPFVPHAAQDDWLRRTLDVASNCGADVISLIPTRAGNGTMDALAADGLFSHPTVRDLERSVLIALRHGTPPGVRLIADTWDLDTFATCRDCLPSRRDRLVAMNLEQRPLPAAACPRCGEEPPS